MEEDFFSDSLPYLRELENKIGRKTPQSLLIWMRDAAQCEDATWSSDAEGECGSSFNPVLSDKIRMLKQEMSCLRSADVRILRQLVTVHDGIEAMRWLMEEQGALTSHSSSLTSSLSSLVTVEGHGLSMSPFRESPNQIETTSEEAEDPLPQTDQEESSCKISDTLSPQSAEASCSSPFTPNCETSPPTQGPPGQDSPTTADSLVSGHSPALPPEDYDVSPYIKTSAKTIRGALLRSSRVRRKVRVDDIFAPAKHSDEKEGEQPTREVAGSYGSPEKVESEPGGETSLLGYDAQWCWVESQDDVTFL